MRIESVVNPAVSVLRIRFPRVIGFCPALLCLSYFRFLKTAFRADKTPTDCPGSMFPIIRAVFSIPSSSSYGIRITSRSAAASSAPANVVTCRTSGIRLRPDCSAAPLAIACQRSCLFFAFFSSSFHDRAFCRKRDNGIRTQFDRFLYDPVHLISLGQSLE